MKVMTMNKENNSDNNENLFISTQKSVSQQEPALNFTVEDIFKCPIYLAEKPEWVDPLNKASDPIIQRVKDSYKKKKLGIPNSYHSELLWQYGEFKPIAHLILQQSWNILSWQGYDLTSKVTMLTDLCVQEFPEQGGFHDIHQHGNNHISGFYFLKASKKTSHPFFVDPRPGKMMSDMRVKDNKIINYANSQVHYTVKPGQFIFFNSYMPHAYIHHKGKEKFRFIHFNMQAVIDPKNIGNVKEANQKG